MGRKRAGEIRLKSDNIRKRTGGAVGRDAGPDRLCVGVVRGAGLWGLDRTMHEIRNFILIILVAAAAVWAFLALFVLDPDRVAFLTAQKVVSVVAVIGLGTWMVYALGFEDKLPDHMREHVGEMYYGVDGLTFMPTVRNNNGQAELCVYYQNRYENPAQSIVHLRPPEDSFIIRPGVRDVHFAFKAGGGDFGVIHQPVAVPEHLQGEVIDIQLAAASYYPRGQGSRLRKRVGMPCGSLLVDWGGSAFKAGVHEVAGGIDLTSPVTLHLSMPKGVNSFCTGNESWRQECIVVGTKG